MDDLTGDELWKYATVKNNGRPPRIIDARSGGEVRLGEPFEFDDAAIGVQTLTRLGDAIIRADSLGLYGVFVDEQGHERNVPMPLSYNHPNFPGELVLFVPT